MLGYYIHPTHPNFRICYTININIMSECLTVLRLLIILTQITRPSDRKSLCLANKELREIAIPLLYRTVDLDVGGPKDMRLSAGLLSRDNPGLKHIRKLVLNLEDATGQEARMEISDDSSDEAEEPKASGATVHQVNFSIRLLLDVIPVNTLEYFRCNTFSFACFWTFNIFLSKRSCT